MCGPKPLTSTSWPKFCVLEIACPFTSAVVKSSSVSKSRTTTDSETRKPMAQISPPGMDPLGTGVANTFMKLFLSRVPEIGLQEYVAALAELNGLARQYSQFFERYPLILGPVSTAPPFTVGKDLASADDAWEIFRSMRLVVTVNLLGLPSAVVPVGVANSLPQGVQVMGSMFREDLCLDAAEVIEDALGVLTPIDPNI